jgi:gas vesicle protein GvpL/GvpF
MARARLRSNLRLAAKVADPSDEPTRGTYLYCVVRSTTKPRTGRAPAGLPGGARPAVVAAGRSLWLVVSEVPLDRYGPERLETALRDLDWVAEVAVAHEAVVEHFARLRGTAVVPMKLFTMFSTEQRAADEMQQRRKDIDAVLKRIAGCEEWGIRVIQGPDRTVPLPAPDVRSGAAFLAGRKQARDNRRAAVERAAAAAATVFDALSPITKDARRRLDAPAGAVPPLLDAAFLVPSAKRARFRGAARRAAKACAEAGAQMTMTGPWPAYNFVQPPGGHS